MMLNIKNKKKENEINELSKHSQNVKVVIRQESNVVLEKKV